MAAGGQITEQGRIYGCYSGNLEYVTEDYYRKYFSGMDSQMLEEMLAVEKRDEHGKVTINANLYGIFAVISSAILSILTEPAISNAMSGMLWFFSYRFTQLPLLVVIPVFAGLGFLLPLISYRNAAKQTIVERLRIEE